MHLRDNEENFCIKDPSALVQPDTIVNFLVLKKTKVSRLLQSIQSCLPERTLSLNGAVCLHCNYLFLKKKFPSKVEEQKLPCHLEVFLYHSFKLFICRTTIDFLLYSCNAISSGEGVIGIFDLC